MCVVVVSIHCPFGRFVFYWCLSIAACCVWPVGVSCWYSMVCVGAHSGLSRIVGPCEFSFSVALRHQMTMLWEADESFSLWLKPAGHQSQPGRRCRKKDGQQTFAQLFDGFLCDTAT